VKLRNPVTKSSERPKAIASYVRLAQRYADQGAFANAVAVYNQILELDASDIDSRFKLALIYEHLGLVWDALSTYEMVATSYALAGQFEQATDLLGRMASLDPESVVVRIKYAEALSAMNRIEDAANQFSAGAELLRSQGRMDDYIKVAERLLFHRQDLALAREVAELYLERNDAKRALSKLQACFQANPKDVSTLELLARAFHVLGQNPKTIKVYREIARVYDEAKRPEERSRNLRKILELDPNDAEAKTALGIAPAQPSRRDVSSLLDKSPDTVVSGGSSKARQLEPFAEHSSSTIADDAAPIRPSTPEPTERNVTNSGATVHRAGEQRSPYAAEDDEIYAVPDEKQDRPRNNKDAHPTLRGAAPITLLTGDRTRTRKASLVLDLESYTSAVRQSVVSDSLHNELDAHSARVQAALQMTQVAEQVLQRRVSDFRTNHRATAKDWAPIVGAFCDISVREKVFGDAARKQRAFHAKRFAQAMDGADMSLGVMSGWFRPTWRIEPEIIARAMQDVVGIPDGAEEMVFRLGAVRNVLAHRHEYERKAHRSLGAAVGWVCRTRIAGRDVIDVPLQCFDEMDSLVARLIERGE
jgi:tetratricopeptide (TPR) repeat protein